MSISFGFKHLPSARTSGVMTMVLAVALSAILMLTVVGFSIRVGEMKAVPVAFAPTTQELAFYERCKYLSFLFTLVVDIMAAVAIAVPAARVFHCRPISMALRILIAVGVFASLVVLSFVAAVIVLWSGHFGPVRQIVSKLSSSIEWIAGLLG